MTNELHGTDPIIKEHRVGRFAFGSDQPTAGPNGVLIWKSATGKIYGRQSPPTLSERLVGTFQVYEVDMQQHPTQLAYDLPSTDSGKTFKVVLRATWQVRRPELVVENLVRNAEAVHDAWLTELLRKEGSQYDIREKDVEQKINQRLAASVGHERYGIVVIDLKVVVSLDEPTQRYVDELLRRERQHDVDVAAARNQQVLDQLNATARTEMETAEANHKAYLSRMQTNLEVELEKQRREAERLIREQEERLTLQLKRSRMEFYTEALKAGNAAIIILQLTEHPEDVAGVLHFLLEDRRIGFENSSKMLQALIDADVINHARLDAPLQAALDNVLAELRPATHGFALPNPREEPASIEATVTEPATGAVENAEPTQPAGAAQQTQAASVKSDVDEYE